DINPSYEWSEEAKELNVSHRELEVLGLVVEGYKNREIAQILKIQHQSVKNHLQHLFKKLGVKNSTQAYIIALHHKMIRMRGMIPGCEKASMTELTAEDMIGFFRDVISGKVKVEGTNEKRNRRVEVWLKEHGIEPYSWESR
ncbi:MAG: helix-turn-helix transcriptional regulator, partial [Dehalococcoidia bacterium]|nr:helix-turn-helix transcriptional regulator [Dehalococcoidia bacterium]